MHSPIQLNNYLTMQRLFFLALLVAVTQALQVHFVYFGEVLPKMYKLRMLETKLNYTFNLN